MSLEVPEGVEYTSAEALVALEESEAGEGEGESVEDGEDNSEEPEEEAPGMLHAGAEAESAATVGVDSADVATAEEK